MEFGKLNITLSLEAKQILINYQKENGFKNIDSATDSYILEKSKLK